MKLSIAASSLLLTTTTVVNAFQSSNRIRTTTSNHVSSLMKRNAIAADPLATLEETFMKSPVKGGNNKSNGQDREEEEMDMTGIALSGMKGQALKWTDDDFPTALEIRSVIPKDCFESDTKTSLGYLSVSVVGTALCTALGVACLNILPPENLLTAPLWILYSGITGTVAMGLWVLAHECGHGAFSKNKSIQDTVGYVLHSLFLVPYYSWQRSHAVHHRYTNHMELGETHVPEPITGESLGKRQSFMNKFGSTLGLRLWGGLQAFLHLAIGWPAYLLIGATGGSDRGMTNHYWPDPLTTPKQPKMELFPGSWKEKVFKSDIGVAAVATGAIVWAVCNGLPQMMALYGGPLIVVNAWLVLYTW
jgi:Fatty acid desaturase